jgi:Xaa-Pro aminopeptidase
MRHNNALYKERRQRLQQSLSSWTTQDTIVLCAALEPKNSRFVQDSTFYYFTGLNEPGAVLCIEGDGTERLFVPRYNGMRAQWVSHEITVHDSPALYGVDSILYQGDYVGGYSLYPFMNQSVYRDLVQYSIDRVGMRGSLYVVGPLKWCGTYGQQLAWYLGQQIHGFNECVVDMSSVVAMLRRKKDSYELFCIAQAIDRTAAGQKVASQLMQTGRREGEIRAALEAEFVRLGSSVNAFPSIVAAGGNATILHYLGEQGILKAPQAVVVDIGATYDGYAADITRTYPVDGVFSERQRMLYQIVLDTQAYIASCARPGMYLNNPHDQQNSLQHKTIEFLEQYGLGKYMPHGIGHFMGLDVHDVGDRLVPLGPGDVITIEPGVYISDEKIGIRIEDDYLITEAGARCLSDGIVKELADIEES